MTANDVEANFSRLSEIIYYHRRRAGLSRALLAEIAGVGKTVIYDVEHGKKSVRLDTLQKILLSLNILIEFKSPLMNDFNEREYEKS